LCSAVFSFVNRMICVTILLDGLRTKVVNNRSCLETSHYAVYSLVFMCIGD